MKHATILAGIAWRIPESVRPVRPASEMGRLQAEQPTSGHHVLACTEERRELTLFDRKPYDENKDKGK